MRKNNLFFLTALMSLGFASYYAYAKEIQKTRSFALEFTHARIPHLKTSLNSIHGYFLLDLGADINCSISHQQKQGLDKANLIGKKQFINFTSSIFEVEQYHIDQASFLGLDISDLIVASEPGNQELFERRVKDSQYAFLPKNFIQETDVIGSLGNNLLKNLNFLIDFKNLKMSIYPKGFVPFFNYPHLNIVSTKTFNFEYVQDLGFVCVLEIYGELKRFLLDTGSSHSLIRSSSLPQALIKSSKERNSSILNEVIFKIENYEFVIDSIYVSDEFKMRELDGILGMDFFYGKSLFFDNLKRRISIRI
jgi:hypothetical protein